MCKNVPVLRQRTAEMGEGWSAIFLCIYTLNSFWFIVMITSYADRMKRWCLSHICPDNFQPYGASLALKFAALRVMKALFDYFTKKSRLVRLLKIHFKMRSVVLKQDFLKWIRDSAEILFSLMLASSPLDILTRCFLACGWLISIISDINHNLNPIKKGVTHHTV